MLADVGFVSGGESLAGTVVEFVRKRMATLGLPDANLEEHGIDLDLGAAFFITEGSEVAVLPVSDRAKFVLAMKGTLASEYSSGVDSLGGGRVCQAIDARYVCGSSAALLATLVAGKGLSGEVASWPETHRGQLEAFVSPSKLSDRPFIDVFAKLRGVRVAAQINKGEIEVRAHVVGVPTGVLAQIVPAPSPLLSELRTTPSSGVIALGFSRVWSAYGAVLIGMVPDKDIRPGMNPHALLQSIEGDMVAMAAPGKFGSAVVTFGLSDESAFTRMLDNCETLGSLMPGSEFNLVNARCTLSITTGGVEYQIGLKVESKRLVVDVELGVADAVQTAIGTPSTEVHAVAKKLADENWNIAAWGYGSIDALIQNIVESMKMELGAMPPDASALIWAAAHLNEFGFGVRVADDGAHAWFKLRTAWSNSDPVMSELRLIFRGLAASDISAVESLAEIQKKYPDSRWSKDTRDGGGGIIIAGTVGILAAVAIPAFMKYMKRSKASEAEQTLRRLQVAASQLAAEGKLPPSAPRTPPVSADCTHEGGREKFAVNAKYWEHPTWQALGLTMSEEHYYAYEFVNNGDWYQIFAYGDLDCDGDYSRYALGGNLIKGLQVSPQIVVEDGLE